MDYDEIFEMFRASYVGKEIRKDIILEKLTDSENKEIVERFVNNFYIKYSVKAEDINKKAEENFEEIQIIEIAINDFRAIYDIYGILLSIIPYPILAIFKYKDRVSFAVSNRILKEEKNNKGKIYTSYLMKEGDIAQYLKIDIDSCKSMIEIYNKWISNIEDVIAYYERLDKVMEIIEIGFHIKSDEVLEKLESYIVRDCGTYNMKPKDGWKSKLEKYEDNELLAKKVETHMLWEYLSDNTFLKNKLEDFLSWKDFKEVCSYNNSMNDIYYSQYNSRMSKNDETDYMYENTRSNNSYKNRNEHIKVELIESKPNKSDNIDNKIQSIVEEFKEKGFITESELVDILSEKFDRPNKEIISKVLDAFEESNIKILEDAEDEEEYIDNELKEDSEFMLQAESTPLYQYITQNFDENENYTIIELCKIQPNVMLYVATNILYLFEKNNNIKYKDYIAILPERYSFWNACHYSMEKNIKYICILGLNILNITEDVMKQIKDYLLKFNVEYHMKKKVNDIILTIYPIKEETIDFIFDILESNNVEYEFYEWSELDEIESAQTSLWMFETSMEDKEEISKILSEIDQGKLNRLKDMGAPEWIIQNESAPVNCNYGIIVDSSLQSLIENILQSQRLEYKILDKYGHDIEA